MSGIVVADDSGAACDTRRLSDLVGFLLPRLRLHPDCEVGVTLVDVDRMSALHEEWMDEPGPTDVLSFPMDELRPAADGEPAQAGMLGDIVLCPAFALEQAEAAGRPPEAELEFLVVHGMLHLIGFDHATQAEYDEMFAFQDEVLAAWREFAGG